MRAALVSIFVCLAAGCTPPAEETATQTPTETAAVAEGGSAPKEGPAPEIFAGSAWRSISADGARYTTYLDSDGTYRDLRNGDPWQSGTWRYDVEAGPLLCLTPDADGGVERCWKPGKMRGQTMTATGEGERRIHLERVEYTPPGEEGEAPA